jgi:hypothetical protein
MRARARRLHDVEPLEGLEMLPPSHLSRLVASKALRTVPYPLLGENTLVISDSCVLAPDDNGHLALLFRVGDTYPNQHLEVVVRAYVYRWRPGRKPGTSGLPNVRHCWALRATHACWPLQPAGHPLACNGQAASALWAACCRDLRSLYACGPCSWQGSHWLALGGLQVHFGLHADSPSQLLLRVS